MARQSKGKPIKVFTASVPDPDLTIRQCQIQVYFLASSGEFAIYLPEHIAAVVSEHPNAPRGEHFGHGNRSGWVSNGIVLAITLQAAIDLFGGAVQLYRNIFVEQNRKRVIKVNYQRNRSDDARSGVGRQMHFSPAPALSLTYDILWQVGNVLYQQDDPEDRLRQHGTASEDRRDGTFLIDWTPEREKFFIDLTSAMSGLIDRLDSFFVDLPGNTDRAIEGKGAILLLAGESSQ